MSAQPKQSFSPEEKQSYRAWLFGTTLDWESLILAEIGHPPEIRWFVASVQGICQKAPPKVKAKGVPIAHSVLAKRADRFRNKTQARDLAKRAIEEDREWSRLKRMMIFDIESPKPGQMEGKDKRARTKYTDYLTPAAVYAQDVEHRVKKSDEVRWKKDTKYRVAKRREILTEAIKMLPAFGSREDMPPSCQEKEKKPLSMREYVEQREKILLAENKRILDRLLEGDLSAEEEINERLLHLQLHFEKASHEIEERYQSTREILVGMLNQRKYSKTSTPANTPEVIETPLLDDSDTTYRNAKAVCKGVMDAPPSETAVVTEIESGEGQISPIGETAEGSQEGVAHTPLVASDSEVSDEPLKTGIPFTITRNVRQQLTDLGYSRADVDAMRPQEAQDIIAAQRKKPAAPAIVDPADVEDGEPNMLAWALYWATVKGFPVVPAYTTEGRKCACHLSDKCRSAGKHPHHDARDLPDGLENATTDEQQIRVWWARWPKANILGRMKDGRRLAVDVDVQSGGDASLYDLTEANGEGWLQTRTHKSGGGGPHMFFLVPESVDFRKAKLAPGIDLKWTNGGIILPPSIHHTGNRYEVIDALPELLAPDWLLEMVTLKPGQQPAKVIDFQEGAQRFADSSKQKFYESNHERNSGLFGVLFGRWLHGYMANSAEFYTQAHSLNFSRCVPPLDTDEIEKLCDDFLANYSHLKDSEAVKGASA